MEKIKNIIIYACDEKKTYAIAINEDDKREIITESSELRKTVFALYENVVGKSTSDFKEAVKYLFNSKHLLASNNNVIVEIHYNKEDDITKNVEVKRLDGTKTVITADQDDFEEKLKNVINEVTTTYGSKEALTDLNIFTFENVTSTKQATVENESTQEENETEEAEEEQNFDEEEIEEAVERRNPGVKKFKIFVVMLLAHSFTVFYPFVARRHCINSEMYKHSESVVIKPICLSGRCFSFINPHFLFLLIDTQQYVFYNLIIVIKAYNTMFFLLNNMEILI